MEQPVKTILLVEDDETNRKLVRVVLADRHYCIREAENVEQALALLRDCKPDLMLFDIRLGDGSGLDLIHAVRADPSFNAVPAVALTAQAMKDDAARFLSAGFDGYVSKPVDTRRLPEVVARFIHEGRGSGHA